jgi:lysosomal Pro-X carboxypeptidase
MGNFPYPSSYILNGNGILPAYPVRVACESLKDKDLHGVGLLSAFASALGVFYNYSGVTEETTMDLYICVEGLPKLLTLPCCM